MNDKPSLLLDVTIVILKWLESKSAVMYDIITWQYIFEEWKNQIEMAYPVDELNLGALFTIVGVVDW